MEPQKVGDRLKAVTRVRAALGIVATLLLISACSTGSASKPRTFDTSGPIPSFSIPTAGSGRGCTGYRAQVSLVGSANGSIRWTTVVPWAERAESIVSDERVFEASNSSVVAMRLSDGRPLWQRPINAMSVSPELQLAGGLPIVLEAQSDKWAIVALSPSDGSDVWRQSLAGSLNDSIQVDADSVFAGDGHGHLFAYDARTGTRRWTARFGKDNTSVSLTLSDGVLFARGGNGASGVAAFDPATGTRLWATGDGETIVVIGTTGSVLVTLRFPPHGLQATTIAFRVNSGQQAWARLLPGPPKTAAPTLASEQVVSYASAEVAGVDRANGQPRWTAPIKAATAAGDSSILLVTSPATDQLIALNPTTGATLWSHNASAEQMATPDLVTGGTIYLGVGRSSTGWNGPDNGAVEAINAANGRARWTTEMRDAVLTEPVSTPDGLVVTSADGALFCD